MFFKIYKIKSFNDLFYFISYNFAKIYNGCSRV